MTSQPLSLDARAGTGQEPADRTIADAVGDDAATAALQQVVEGFVGVDISAALRGTVFAPRAGRASHDVA